MAIDLPPALPPQLTAQQEVARYSENYATVQRKIGKYELRISGEHGLTQEELNAILDKSQSPSQAILLINSSSHKKGLLLVRFFYTSPVNGVINVHAIQHRVGHIQGPDFLQRHFSSLTGDRELIRKEFQTPAILAGLRADRAGVNYTVSYEQNTQINALDLVFSEKPIDDFNPATFKAQLGNQGSRFAGRYFFDAGLTYNFSSGTEFGAGYETALTDWGEARDGKDYHRIQLQLNHPYSFGLYGIEASHAEYERNITAKTIQTTFCVLPLLCIPTSNTSESPLSLDAKIQQIALTGNQVLSSDIDHRFMLNQRIEFTDSVVNTQHSETLQDERYATATLGANYYSASLQNNRLFTWKVGLAVEGGLGSDQGTLGSDNDSQGVTAGKRSARFVALKPTADVSYSLTKNSRALLSIKGQISNEQLPQQQQWVLGGMERLSAYLPGVLVGDSGYHLDAALSHRSTWGGLTLDSEFFVEYGSAQFENAAGTSPNGGTDYSIDSSLADAGFRFTLSYREWLTLNAVAARPLDDSNISKQQLEEAEADFFVTMKITL